jgi:plastocyanin
LEQAETETNSSLAFFVIAFPGTAYNHSVYDEVPANHFVSRGTTVIWENQNPGTIHSLVVSDMTTGLVLFAQPGISDGKTAEFTFDKSGGYQYYDPNYPAVKGTIQVSA